MIDRAAVAEIAQTIATYRKHGWVLRRVLLSANLQRRLGQSIDELFGDAARAESDIDAAWFSRPPRTGPKSLEVAWEIRHLSETPYALLEVLDETAPDFELSLQNVESRLRENVAKKRIP